MAASAMPKKEGRGNLFIELHIATLKPMSDTERELFEALREQSTFNPRD